MTLLLTFLFSKKIKTRVPTEISFTFFQLKLTFKIERRQVEVAEIIILTLLIISFIFFIIVITIFLDLFVLI